MADFDIEQFPTSPAAQRMLDFVTKGFYDRSYVGKWLYQVMGLEMDDLKDFIDEMIDQAFVDTATWGLMYHEIKWGLPVRENLSYDERRRLIYEKRDFKAPMTPVRMEGYLSDCFDIQIRICDAMDPGHYGWTAPNPNSFRVYFVDDIDDEIDGSVDIPKAKEIIDRLKQSHTTYDMIRLFLFHVYEGDIENADTLVVKVKFPITEKEKMTGLSVEIGPYCLNESEAVTKAAIVNHSNPYYFLDGEIALNGTAILNSYYEQEDL